MSYYYLVLIIKDKEKNLNIIILFSIVKEIRVL